MADKTYPHMLRGVLFALAGGTCWGFSATCAELLTSSEGYGVPVNWLICVRLVASAVILVGIALATPANRANMKGALTSRRTMVTLLAFGVLGMLFTQASYLTTISYTNAGTATLLEYLGAALVMLVCCVQARRLPYAREVLGLVLALVSVYLVATKGQVGVLAIPLIGLIWGLLSAVSQMFYTVLPEQPTKDWGSVVVNALGMSVAAVGGVLIMQPWQYQVTVTPDMLVPLACIVVVGTVAAFLLFLQGVAEAGALRAGLVASVEPVSAMAFSALWLGTPVTPADVAGLVLIIIMLFLVAQKEDAAA
ncbi:MAG: DMT family transporter [Coriobacteriia bacterium]|nr:DMT family transporter [Coriobacteriia bacterium]